MSIKATHAMFPYSVSVDTYDSDGNIICCDVIFDTDAYDEKIPYMSECTMTASKWVKEYWREELYDLMGEGDVATADVTIKFFHNFIDKSYDECFLESTCKLRITEVDDEASNDVPGFRLEYEVIESDDDEIAEKEKEMKQDVAIEWETIIALVKENDGKKSPFGHPIWTDGSELLCCDETTADVVASFLTSLGFDAHTGYYDPEEDAKDGIYDDHTGAWYIDID